MIYRFITPNGADLLIDAPTLAEAEAAAAVQRVAIETQKEEAVKAAVQILKADVPDAWRTSTNAQQRIAWAMKRLFVETRREILDA